MRHHLGQKRAGDEVGAPDAGEKGIRLLMSPDCALRCSEPWSPGEIASHCLVYL